MVSTVSFNCNQLINLIILQAINLTYISLKFLAVICSKHFEKDCFFVCLKYKLLNLPQPKAFRDLQDNAVPTIFLPVKNSVEPKNRSKRLQISQDLEARKLIVDEVMSVNMSNVEVRSDTPVSEKMCPAVIPENDR